MGLSRLNFTAPLAYWASAGVNRVDSQLENGDPAGSSYELLQQQVLDLYPIKHAILTSQFYPGTMSGQFEFASALASAYNDWVIEHLLLSWQVAYRVDAHEAAYQIHPAPEGWAAWSAHNLTVLTLLSESLSNGTLFLQFYKTHILF